MSAERAKVVFLGPDEGRAAAAKVLEKDARVVSPALEPSAVADSLRDAHAVLDASMKVPISDAMIAAAANLKIISCATTGSDHIKRGELEKRNIPVHTLREDRELLLNLTPAAELTFALLLACARKLPSAVAAVKRSEWVREDFPGLMLNGRTLGIIGCGRIGTWMGRYARAFAMRTIGYDPFVQTLPDGIERVSLEEMAETSDAISVHVHLSDQTRELVSADLFRRMKPGAIFLNTSRGAVADEAALLEGLKSGRISAAGLDVLEGEPDIAKHPLRLYAETHDNLLITPHCGGFSPDAVKVVCRRAAEKIREHLRRK